jgi:hypothetical protein
VITGASRPVTSDGGSFTSAEIRVSGLNLQQPTRRHATMDKDKVKFETNMNSRTEPWQRRGLRKN